MSKNCPLPGSLTRLSGERRGDERDATLRRQVPLQGSGVELYQTDIRYIFILLVLSKHSQSSRREREGGGRVLRTNRSESDRSPVRKGDSESFNPNFPLFQGCSGFTLRFLERGQRRFGRQEEGKNAQATPFQLETFLWVMRSLLRSLGG